MTDQGPVKAFLRRTTTMRTTSIVGAAALILGLALGSGAGRTDPTESPAYVSLQGEFESASHDRNDLLEKAEELSDENADLAAENREMQSAQSALQTDQEQLALDIEGLNKRLAEVEDREHAVEAAEAQLVTVAPPAPDAAPAPPAAEPAPPASAYYDNCTAARNAGAAPVRSGDPGYGPHLDRDGDGVACE
jgi:septal ring factor EnvC (AmiA/AmiB activator)